MNRLKNNTQVKQDQAFDLQGRFIIRDYHQQRPFSSFLPGIAGLNGIPMWVFYVNRGQGVCSFGIENKDHPILEFQPANKAYQGTSLKGFRTFLNGYREGKRWQREAFAPWSAPDVRRTMYIGMNELEIQEIHPELGYQINVLYFMLPNLPFAGLVRRLHIKNLDESSLKLEVLDGLPVVVPYGVDDGALKHVARTIEAWMQVENVEQRLPFYRLKATPGDTADVQAIRAGNFAAAYHNGSLLSAVADPAAVFGADTGLSEAHLFHKHGLKSILQATQIWEGRSLCAFFGGELYLEPGDVQEVTSLYGFGRSLTSVQTRVNGLMSDGLIDKKLAEARELVIDLTGDIRTESALPRFDGYSRHTFLDNLLRGGYPLVLGGQHIVHVFARKHGDIERDYNYFVLPPEYYSQGNGNYRDINQNRRNDVYFVPEAGEFNIQLFMGLIQADGYNPLVFNGLTFSISQADADELLKLAENDAALQAVLEEPFTPGELFGAAIDARLTISADEFMARVFTRAEMHIQAEHGEGYWVDHWTYNLDLIESYLAVFPEKKYTLLFDSEPLPFYDNAHVVQPRSARYVLHNGEPRQFNAVVEDVEKAALMDSRPQDRHWARADHGKGEVFRLTLFSKLVLLTLIKFATRDPNGMGIQMEAGRPGWYDALNGLPGLFGSSMPETYELQRLVTFLSAVLQDYPTKVTLPVEAVVLLEAIETASDVSEDAFLQWDQCTSALEAYRASIRLGFDGRTESFDLAPILRRMQEQLALGIEKASELTGDVPPTYFIYDVTTYTLTGEEDGHGLPLIEVGGFTPRPLPAFLEGPVRLMKILDKQDARLLARAVRKSDLFDPKLGMYKVNAPLASQSHEIGRARAFTPGWLENESVWLHMAFKYLLELQKAGLFTEFFDALKSHLPAFMELDTYGRSPLENSSFIVSSAHPDATLHGNGFVARLSGSTAEFLTMWVLMTAGKQPFQVDNGELVLAFKPALPGWLFMADGRLSFRFLGQCDVTINNPDRRDTFADDMTIQRIELRSANETIQIEGSVIGSPYAAQVRSGEIVSIELFY